MTGESTVSSKTSNLRHLAALSAAVAAFFLFAGQFVVSKHGVLAGLTPYDIAALRFGVAGLIAAPILIGWGLVDLGGIGWRRGAALALVGGAPNIVLMIGGLSFAPAAHVVVINPGMTLIGGFLLSVFWLGERSSRPRVLIGGFALTGLAAIGWESITNPSDNTWIGNLMFALSGLVWAVYIALLDLWRVSSARAAILVASLSTIYLPIYWLIFTPGFADVPMVELVLQAGYQGIIHSLIAMLLFTHAIRILGAGQISLMTPIVPVSGLAMALLFLGERLSALQWIGASLVCFGMLLAGYHSLRNTARHASTPPAE